MLGAADNAAIRSAIGLGQTDAPTFLAQSLTGQSLTGTQATSLVDLSATWNTTGTPTAIKLNVTDTASNFSSLLLDCQTGGTSRFRVTKNGAVVAQTNADNGGVFSAGSNGFKNIQFGGLTYSSNGMVAIRDPGLVVVRDLGGFCWENGTQNPATGTIELGLFKDAAGILAQRNGTAKQTLRIYNTYTSATVYERAVMDWNGPTPGNLQIGTEFLGSGSGMAARPIDFVVGGTVRMSLSAASDLTVVGSVHTGSGFVFTSKGYIGMPSSGVMSLYNILGNDFNRLQLGGTTSAFPAIKRNGTGIDIKLADDSAFAPIKGKLTTDTNYTAGVPSATGYLTIYDATGTAYRVPCTV
jgi:hypothetical protein